MILNNVTAIEQKVWFRGRQRFEIVGDDVEVSYTRFFLHRQFKIPLADLDPAPVRVKHLPLGPLVGSVIFGATCLGIFVCMFLVRMPADRIGLSFALLLPGTMFAACFYKFHLLRADFLTFHNRISGQALCPLWFEQPNRNVFHMFCETLTAKVSHASKHPLMGSRGLSLTEELTELKKLKDAGALSDEEFEKAKAKLFDDSPPRRIGFHSSP